MSELRIETDGMAVVFTGDPETLWKAATGAVNNIANTLCKRVSSIIETPAPTATTASAPEKARKRPVRGISKADQVRDIAQEVLADGRVHERREIAKAARAHGLDAHLINSALEGRFEKDVNSLGRPTYRDRSVASGYNTESPPDDAKPEWMRDRQPAVARPPARVDKWTAGGVVGVERNGDPAGAG